MRLAAQLVLYISMAAVLPLAVLGAGAATVASRHVLEKTADLQGRTAEAVAVYVDTWMELQVQLLQQQVRTLPVERLSPEAREVVPRLIVEQSSAVDVAMLVSSAGVSLAPPAMPAAWNLSPESVDLRARALMREVPPDVLSDTSDMQTWVSKPYFPPSSQWPAVAAVTRSEAGTVFVVELSLASLARRVGIEGTSGVQVAVLDEDGEVVLGGGHLIHRQAFAGLLGGVALDIRYKSQDGIEAVAASAPLDQVHWTVVVAEPLSSSERALREIQQRTAYIALVCLTLSLVVAVLFSRQFTAKVGALKDAAMRVADGDYGRLVEVDGVDELADLGTAFNHMSGRLAEDATRIAVQNEEIAAFNRQLQERVDARTQELREAQAQLVQSARLAAVGEMGAGLAHELNNPVAGILGLVQVLLAKADDGPFGGLLRGVEAQALRCRDILANLQGFSQDIAEAGTERLDLSIVIRDVLTLVRGPLQVAGLDVSLEVPSELWVRGRRAELGRSFAWLTSSVRAAAPGGGSLQMEGNIEGEKVVLAMVLRAKQLAIGGDDWKAAGMGLWNARRVLVAHGGRLVEPVGAVSDSAVWRIELPLWRDEV